MYADVELLLTGWFRTQLGEATVCTDLPADLADVLPLVQVVRFGGPDILPGLDVAHVDVDAYAATRQAARDLAEQCRHLVRFVLPGVTAVGGTVSKTDTITGPVARYYDGSTAVHRFSAAYRLTVHATA